MRRPGWAPFGKDLFDQDPFGQNLFGWASSMESKAGHKMCDPRSTPDRPPRPSQHSGSGQRPLLERCEGPAAWRISRCICWPCGISWAITKKKRRATVVDQVWLGQTRWSDSRRRRRYVTEPGLRGCTGRMVLGSVVSLEIPRIVVSLESPVFPIFLVKISGKIVQIGLSDSRDQNKILKFS